jgi:sec-independent protein translocase protein TatC
MTDASPPPDGAQEAFISHLIGLRGRLLRSIVAVIIVLLCLVPWAKQILRSTCRPADAGAAAGCDDDSN